MDFTPRPDNSADSNVQVNRKPVGPAFGGNSRKNSNPRSGRILRYCTAILLFSVAVLVLAVASSFAFSGDHSQAKYVKKGNLQAVFLNGGQVYFGNITNLSKDYLTVSNVYYLRVNQAVQPDNKPAATNNNDVSLVKLGCELHGPEDRMVVNQSQVIFWENLKTDGQVAKAVAQFQKQNPNGQDCTAQKATTQPTQGSATTPATNDKQ